MDLLGILLLLACVAIQCYVAYLMWPDPLRSSLPDLPWPLMGLIAGELGLAAWWILAWERKYGPETRRRH